MNKNQNDDFANYFKTIKPNYNFNISGEQNKPTAFTGAMKPGGFK